MFQKQEKMSLKKKSKSMGHLNIESPIFDNTHIIPKKKSYPGEDFKSGVRTTPKKLKGLVRQRTNPMMMPVSVGKAIFSKANKTSSKQASPSLSEVFGSKENVLIPNRHRTFLMDTQVKFTVGLQCQERNLFLFNDLLIIAKERSGNQFKLKDQVPLSDVWLANCLSEVSELTTDMLNSFVIGWPITNAIITFSSPSLRNLWWDKLSDLIESERILAPSSTNIQVTYFDQSTNFEHVKSLSVTVRDDAKTCVTSALRSLELIGGNRPPLVDVNCDYQLWVRTKTDEAPYPLIGHEIPLVIKLYWTRQAFINSRNQKTFDEYRAGCRCSFILRKTGQTYSTNGEDGLASKNKLKKVKSSMKLQRVFRRASKNNDIMDSSGAGDGSKKFEGQVFGRHLEEVCVNDVLPIAIIVILKRIISDGPGTVGIFRRSPNARAMRELREKIDQNEKVDFEECSVFVVAALLKDFLRSLPDCLLQCPKYDDWIRIGTEYESDKDIRPMKNLISNLPRINELTLRHLVYLLKEIADKSKTNMMNASNLGICVGPSVLWCNDSKVMMETNYSKDVSCLTKTLIEQYEPLFGPEVPSLFTHDAEQCSSIQTETGPNDTVNAEESLLDNDIPDDEDDRMVISTASVSRIAASGGIGEGLSLNNLSQDSGLTTSDSQLFAFEGPENNSFSSDDFCTAASNKKLMIYANKSKIHIPVPVSVSDFHHHSKIPFRIKPTPVSKTITADDTPIKIENNHRKILVSRVGNVNSYMGSSSSPCKIPLRRTASEESVSITGKSPETSRKRRPVFHRKGKAPAPPSSSSNNGGGGTPLSNNVARSNSVNHNRIEGKNGSLWYRSCSTTRLNSGSSSTCSTLTDEDSSTPIRVVSRSNSYGKDNENFVDGSPMTIEIGNNCNTPPGYEETISRQRILKGFHRSNSCLEGGEYSSRGMVEDEGEEVIVDQEGDIEVGASLQHPPPLPPKTERPPLPPKQRQRISSGVKLDDSTYVNSEELRKTEEGFVYPQYSSVGTVHVSTVSDSPDKTTNKKRSVTRIVATPTRSKSTRSVETQTEEKDFFSLYSSDSDSFEESEEDHRHLLDYTPRFQSDYYHHPVNHLMDQQRSLSPHRFSNSSNTATPDRRRLDPPVSSDPLIQGEINWSVSQLRSFFNQGQQKQNSSQINVPQYSPQYSNYNSIRSPNADQRRNHNNNNNNNIICHDVNMYSPKTEQDSDQESYV